MVLGCLLYTSSIDTSGVKWSVNGNIISGYTTIELNPKESVTIALPLPEGYFDFRRCV